MSVTIQDEESGPLTIKLSESGRISLSDITAATIGDLETWTYPDSTTPSPKSLSESQLGIAVLRPWEEKSRLNKTSLDLEQSHLEDTDNTSVQYSTVSNSNNHIKRQLEDFYNIAEGPMWKRQKNSDEYTIRSRGDCESQNTFTNSVLSMHHTQNSISSASHYQQTEKLKLHDSTRNDNCNERYIQNGGNSIFNVTSSSMNNNDSQEASSVTNKAMVQHHHQRLLNVMYNDTNNVSDQQQGQKLGQTQYPHAKGQSKVCENYHYPSLSQLCEAMDSPFSPNTQSREDTVPISAANNYHASDSPSVSNMLGPVFNDTNVLRSIPVFDTPVSRLSTPKLEDNSFMTAFSTPVSRSVPAFETNTPGHTIPKLTNSLSSSLSNTPVSGNGTINKEERSHMAVFNRTVSDYESAILTNKANGSANDSPVTQYNQYSTPNHNSSSLGNISNFYKDHFKVKDTNLTFPRSATDDHIKNEPVTPVAQRPPPLPSYSMYDSPGVESRFNESLSNLIGSPPPDSPLSKNPFFSDLQALLSTECKSDLLPKTLFGIHDSVPSRPVEEENIFLRERKLHDRFNDLQASHPDEVRNLSSFFRYQTAMIETERFRTLHESQYPREHKTSVNRFYDNKIHKVINRVEQSVVLLENANREKENKKQIVKPRPHLNRDATRLMEKWYLTNMEHPYPTNTTIEMLANNGNISTDQVKKWFANKRNRSQNTRTLTEIAMKKRKLGQLVSSN